jgi:leucyl aminopeptidase
MVLPDFTPLKITQSSRSFARATLDDFDQVLIVIGKGATARQRARLPLGRQIDRLLARAAKRDEKSVVTRVDNSRATGVTVAVFDAASKFAELTWARKALQNSLREKPGSLAIVAAELGAADEQRAVDALVAAAHAAAFELPTYRTRKPKPPALKTLRLFATQRIDLAAAHALALGNNLARWFTALPPNVLTAESYRASVEELARRYSIECEFLDEQELKKRNAGAFLAVAQGNAARDAGIVHLTYRPSAVSEPGIALVGKGILFDTGGTNLKPFKGMLDMHMDMQGSAVALGSLLALAERKAPFRVDAWLALTENRLSPTSYKSQDVVFAANGTSIQVIHTDAEGRMALADTLTLAANEKPQVIIDYATLTGACVVALGQQFSGVFTNRESAHQLLIDAGAASGERVWPFPTTDDYDEALKSEIADVKQCAVETPGDHILAARFLSRFVPAEIPWIHVDLSAGQRESGLAHVPTEVTGFGVRFTLELLCNRSASPRELAERLPA